MVGWGLWSLRPAGTDQGAQYLVVHVFESRAVMYDQSGDFMVYAKKAYPDLSEEELSAKFEMTVKSKDILC